MVSGGLGDLLMQAAAICGAAIGDNGPLLSSLFIAGLAGGATHCAGMCGPFVIAQAAARGDRARPGPGGELRRVAGALLVPYHLGRATTYAALGAGAAGLAASVEVLAGVRYLAPALLFLAAIAFLAYGAKLAGLVQGAGRTGGRLGFMVAAMVRPLFARPVGVNGYALGVALGFLPCGLLYAAVAAAGSADGPIGGAFAMLAFVGGTVPGLLAVGIAGEIAMRRWRPFATRVSALIAVVNAGVLAYMGWQGLTGMWAA
ncbi:MAG: sulfite exporter TauE/SafE family protein [Alphaproteobacteria bacterium]